MTENPVSPIERFDQRFEAMSTLLERLLADPDRRGVADAARRLGLFSDGEVVLGAEDEAGALLDYYLFEIPQEDGRSRIQEFIDAPLENLSPLELEVLQELGNTRYGIYELSPGSLDETAELTDMIGGEKLPFAARSTLEVTTVPTRFLLRLFESDGLWLHTGYPLKIQPTLHRFFEHAPTIEELASMLDNPFDHALRLDEDPNTVLLRALVDVAATTAAAN